MANLCTTLQALNRNNYEACCNVGNIDIQTLQYDSEWDYEQYEILTGSYPEATDPDGKLVQPYSREELDDILTDWNEHLDQATNAHGEAEEALEAREVALQDPESRDGMTPESLKAAEEAVESARVAVEVAEKQVDTITDFIYELEQADFETDDVYWNTMWSMDERLVNIPLCNRLGLGVLERDGDQWIFLTGCGMDLSAKLIAYRALRFGCVNREDLHKLRDPEEFGQVLPREVTQEVYRILGIEHCMPYMGRGKDTKSLPAEQQRQISQWDPALVGDLTRLLGNLAQQAQGVTGE